MTKILVLGDSYACCEGVTDINSWWPVQLLRQLTSSSTGSETFQVDRAQGVTRVTWGEHEVTIIAQTGKRSDELIKAIQTENAANPLKNYDWVIMGTGVNNQFQKGAEASAIKQYQQDVQDLITISRTASGGRTDRVLMYSIPYWQVTPGGKTDKERQKYNIQSTLSVAEEINQYNRAAERIAKRNATRFIDITKISAEIGGKADMVTADRYHYSPKSFKKLFLDPLLGVIQSTLKLRSSAQEEKLSARQQVEAAEAAMAESETDVELEGDSEEYHGFKNDHFDAAGTSSLTASGCSSFFSKCLTILAECCCPPVDDNRYNPERRWSR